MMNYTNPYYQVPMQNNMAMTPYPNHFINAMLQPTQSQAQTQVQTQPQLQNQQTITTQPPIMQPQSNVTRILPVANREEATVAPIDLINGTPSYFINKSNGEIYYKQFDVPTGSYIFKTYVQVKETEQSKQDDINITPTTVNYDKELHYISEGIDNLHRMIADLQNERTQEDIEEVEVVKEKNKKRGQ